MFVEYMNKFSAMTYGNCDNVSEHPLDRVCGEVRRLVKEFPQKLTLASTGGPVTGDDVADKRAWQRNTQKLEDAGAMGVEYSLSCPQGGEGAEGAIVSQSAELSAKIVDWVMEVSKPDVPKLFKLTGAVTSIERIVSAIRNVFKRYPQKKCGITLANSFPALTWKSLDVTSSSRWDSGVVVGMSGEGVVPISYLTLAGVRSLGVSISGNGGVMNAEEAAHFIALGCETVQVCTVATKFGYQVRSHSHYPTMLTYVLQIIRDLMSGLSHLMKRRGFESISQLRGAALPSPIVPFEQLPAEKKIR